MMILVLAGLVLEQRTITETHIVCAFNCILISLSLVIGIIHFIEEKSLELSNLIASHLKE